MSKNLLWAGCVGFVIAVALVTIVSAATPFIEMVMGW